MTFTSDANYKAYRSEFEALPGRLAGEGFRHLYGEESILIRTYGESVPIAPFVETLVIPAVMVPTVSIGNNKHSPNENLRLGNFVDGIGIMMSVCSRIFDSAYNIIQNLSVTVSLNPVLSGPLGSPENGNRKLIEVAKKLTSHVSH